MEVSDWSIFCLLSGAIVFFKLNRSAWNFYGFKMSLEVEICRFWKKFIPWKLSFQSSTFCYVFNEYLTNGRYMLAKKRRAYWRSEISRSTTLVLMNFSQNLVVFDKNGLKFWRFLIFKFFSVFRKYLGPLLRYFGVWF